MLWLQASVFRKLFIYRLIAPLHYPTGSLTWGETRQILHHPCQLLFLHGCLLARCSPGVLRWCILWFDQEASIDLPGLFFPIQMEGNFLGSDGGIMQLCWVAFEP